MTYCDCDAPDYTEANNMCRECDRPVVFDPVPTARRLPSAVDGRQASTTRGNIMVELLHARTVPTPGSPPGWRIDHEGREWYSAAWLSDAAAEGGGGR